MSTLTLGLAEAKNNFSKVASEVHRSGRSVTVLKNNKPWVLISPVQSSGENESAVSVAVDFMDEYGKSLKSWRNDEQEK